MPRSRDKKDEQFAHDLVKAVAPTIPDHVKSDTVRRYYSPAKWKCFDRAGWSTDKVAAESQNWKLRLRDMPKANAVGQAQKEVEQLRIQLAERGTMLITESEKPLQEYRELQQKLETAEAHLEDCLAAQQRMRRLATESANAAYVQTLLELAPIQRDVAELISRLHSAEQLRALDVNTLAGLATATTICETQRPDLLKVPDRSWDRKLNLDGWKRFVAEKANEIPAIESQLKELHAKLSQARAACETLLDSWA